MLEYPVGAAFWGLEAAGCAVAGIVDTVPEEEIDLGHNAGDVDAGEVANTSAIIGGGLEARELMLGDLSSADGIVVVGITAGEHVDISVAVIVLIADAEALESGTENGGRQEEGGENGGGWEMHFGLRLVI